MLFEATSKIASGVTGAIRSAARTTGASFEYLLKTAKRESNLNPLAKARSSSATGLFQFIDQTWLQTLKQAGPALGYGKYAAKIEQTNSGRYVVPDANARAEVMRLRQDPQAASAMAGAFTQRNASLLKDGIGRAPTDGELYIAHFLGPSGAVQLINAAEQSPGTSAAAIFPKAARANKPIFFGKTGARSVSEVYAQLVSKHDNTRMPVPTGATQVAGVRAPTVAQAVSAQPPRYFPSSADLPPESAEPVRALGFGAEAGPVFHGLFRTEQRAPVSAVVSELWTPKGRSAPDAIAKAPAPVDVPPTPAQTPAPAPPAGQPMRLFHFLRPDLRALPDRSA